jgi:hypothetical protein
MRALVLFVLVVLVAAASALRCFTREYVWHQSPETPSLWVVEGFDALDARPALLVLADLEIAPPPPDGERPSCVAEAITLGWRSPLAPGSSPGVPFASYAVECHTTRTLEFGVSSLGAREWGNVARTPVGGEVYSPRYGRTDMATASASAKYPPTRMRTLTLSTASGTVRAPVAPVRVLSCVAGDETPEEMDEEGWREEERSSVPRVLPLADCVRQSGDRCGVNLGYTTTEAVNLTRHTAVNRLHPAALENGFHLVEHFEAGLHAPDKHRMHIGWTCGGDDDDGGGGAAWHLDDVVIRFGATAWRCADTTDVSPSSALFTESYLFESARKGVDGDAGVNVAPADSASPPLAVTKVSHEVVEAAWRAQGVAHPYMSETAAAQHAAANDRVKLAMAPLEHHRRLRAAAGTRDADSSSSTTTASWVAFGVLCGVLLFVFVVVVGLAWWYDYDWRDFHAFPHPRDPRRVHYYESAAEYTRIHGHPPPQIGGVPRTE